MQTFSKKQIWITLWVCVGSLLCGIAGGWPAPNIPKLQDLKQTPLANVITDEEASWVGSSIYVGIIIGAYVTGSLSNVMGRKPSLLIGGLIMAVSCAVLATSVNFTMVLVGRILCGVACGMIYVIQLVYLSEIASTNIRGAVLSFTGLAISVGTLMGYSVYPYVSYSLSSYMVLMLSLVFTVGLIMVPETPVFYLLKGNEKKAKEVLKSLGRSEHEADLLTNDSNSSIKQDCIQIFTIRNNRKTLFIILVLLILQNFSGASVLMMFATTIFDFVDSGKESNVFTIVIGATMLLASCITPIVVDKYGRKILLLLSTAVCGFNMMLLGLYFYLKNINHWMVPNLSLIPVISLVIFFLSFNCGFGIIPGTIMSEMFQSNVRGPGSTLVLSAGWLCSCIICTFFRYLIIVLGTHITFWMLSSMNFFAFVFTAVFVPETKGKTFAEIQCILSRSRNK